MWDHGVESTLLGFGVFRFVQGTMYPIVHALALKYFPYGYFKAQVYTRWVHGALRPFPARYLQSVVVQV